MKRLFTLALVLSMVFSLSAAASAAGPYVNMSGDLLAESFSHYETVQERASAISAYNAALSEMVEDYLASHDLTLHFAAYASPSSIGISMESVGSNIDTFMDSFVKNLSGYTGTANSAYVVYIKSTNEYRYRLSFAEGSDIKVDWNAVGDALKGEDDDLTKIRKAFSVIADAQTSTGKEYYADALKWAKDKGIIDEGFSLEDICTRAEAVSLMWRAFGSLEFPSGTTSFADVPESSEYYNAVTWAYMVGATTGISPTEFAPDGLCTRAQIMTLMWRVSGKPTLPTEVKPFSESFSDVSDGAYYAEAVAWASANGITNGTGGGLFSPDGECTHVQIVTFLYRLLA